MTRARRVEMTKKMNNGHKILIWKNKWEIPRENLSVVRVIVLKRILKITPEELGKILLQIERVKSWTGEWIFVFHKQPGMNKFSLFFYRYTVQ